MHSGIMDRDDGALPYVLMVAMRCRQMIPEGPPLTSRRTGDVVPVRYGLDTEYGAVAETIFHDVPVRGALRSILESRLDGRAITTLTPRRDLLLVELHGFGLAALGVTAEELTSTDPIDYQVTVSWAETLHRSFPGIDGLVWMSKQFNSARAIVLFGDRVGESELEVAGGPLPLRVGPGRRLVERAANDARIVILT